jgi:Lon protease-like protein
MTDQPDQKPPAEIDTEKIPELLPILPLFDAALFPKMVLPLVVMQGESVRLVDEAMAKNRIIGLVVSKKPEEGLKPDREDLAQIGTSALILKMAKTQDNRTQLLVQGLQRFKIKSWENNRPYLRARIELLEEKEVRDDETEALMSNLVGQFIRIVELSPGLPPEIGQMAKSIPEAGTLADMIASTINSNPEEKQKVLEIQNLKTRLKEVTRLVNHQLSVLELGNKIQSQVKGDMDKSQKEYYLRQQLKAIKEELGEQDETQVEIEEYRAKIAERNLPGEARKEAERELDRLSRMHPSSAEYTVASTYLDWITALPWHEDTEDNVDIKKAQKILDDDHYGLEKRISGGSQIETRIKRADFMFCRPAGYRKDITGAVNRACTGPQIPPYFPGWRQRRSRPKSGGTGAPMSERSPDASFRACGGLNPIIRSLCWMKLTRSVVIFVGTRRPHFWKCWILNRIFLLPIIIWMCLLISPKSCSSQPQTS